MRPRASLHDVFLIVLSLHALAIFGLMAAEMGWTFFVSLGLAGLIFIGCVTTARWIGKGIRLILSITRSQRRRQRKMAESRMVVPVPLSPSQGQAKLKDDLRFVFSRFPRESLVHLRNQFHRLAYDSYVGPGNTGCLFFLLSEVLPEDRRIVSRESLTRHFTGGSGQRHREMSDYQPARYLVKAFDQKRLARYAGVVLDRELLWHAVEDALVSSRSRL